MSWKEVIVGTNLKASESENAYSYGTFIDINERAKSFGSTVKKKIEKAEIMIKILKIIAIEKENPFSFMNRVFIRMMTTNRNERLRRLFSHCLTNLPIPIRGIKLKKINSKGTIFVKKKVETV